MIRLPLALDEILTRDPIRLVDVGARGGWPAGWKAYRRYVSLVGFEPDRAECERLRSAATKTETFLDSALSRTAGPAILYHYAKPSWTSLYPPNAKLVAHLWPDAEDLKVVRTEEIQTVTLDQALAAAQIPQVDFIKLDTQGSELDILVGADDTLHGPLLGMEMEVEFVPIYQGQPLFADIDLYLRRRGYDFIDFPKMYPYGDVTFALRGARGYDTTGDLVRAWLGRLQAPGGALRGGKRLIYADAVYLRNPDEYLKAVIHQSRPVRSQLLKAVVTCTLLSYFDHAQTLNQLGLNGDWFTGQEYQEIRAWVIRSSQTMRRVSHDFARIARRIAHRLQHLRE